MWAVSPRKAAQALSPKQWAGLDYLFILFVYFFIIIIFFIFFMYSISISGQEIWLNWVF